MPEHTLIVGQEFTTGIYDAECSCGQWSGGDYSTEGDAQDDWDNHCDVVFMEATDGR